MYLCKNSKEDGYRLEITYDQKIVFSIESDDSDLNFCKFEFTKGEWEKIKEYIEIEKKYKQVVI